MRTNLDWKDGTEACLLGVVRSPGSGHQEAWVLPLSLPTALQRYLPGVPVFLPSMSNHAPHRNNFPSVGCSYSHCAVCLGTQSCLTLRDPMDCSPPGSSVHGDSPGKSTGVGCHALLQGIFPTQGSNLGLPPCRQILYHLSHQASPRLLEWGAFPFSRGSSQPRNRTGISCFAGGFFTG